MQTTKLNNFKASRFFVCCYQLALQVYAVLTAYIHYTLYFIQVPTHLPSNNNKFLVMICEVMQFISHVFRMFLFFVVWCSLELWQRRVCEFFFLSWVRLVLRIRLVSLCVRRLTDATLAGRNFTALPSTLVASYKCVRQLLVI